LKQAGCVSADRACLLESKEGHNCLACESIQNWMSQPESTIVVQEIHDSQGMVVYATRESEEPRAGSLMRFRANAVSEEQVRLAVNSLINLANEVWLASEGACTRIKDQK